MKGQTPALKHFIKRGAQDADLSYESMLDEKDSAPEETIDLESLYPPLSIRQVLPEIPRVFC